LLAVGPVIARIAASGLLDFLHLAFKIGARQIVKQHIEGGAKKVFSPQGQMLF